MKNKVKIMCGIPNFCNLTLVNSSGKVVANEKRFIFTSCVMDNLFVQLILEIQSQAHKECINSLLIYKTNDYNIR